MNRRAVPSTGDAESTGRRWRCEACGARHARLAVAGDCRLCGGPLVIDLAPATPLPTRAAAVLHDRGDFVRASIAFLATCEAIPDEIVAGFAVPADLEPVYVPFRRTRPAPAGAVTGPGSTPADACLAPGLDARERAALASLARGHPVDELQAAPEVGPVLCGVDPPGGVTGTDYLVPVWVWTLPGLARPLRLLMDAGSGCFVGFAPAALAPARAPARVEVLGHWAWLPALFCLVLALLVGESTVRSLLVLLALATLLGGYLAAAELKRALERGRRRLAVDVWADGAGAADAVTARRELAATQRAISWLPGAYAAIAVCAHVGVTAFVAGHANALHAESPEAASLVPWSPADPNLRGSSFAAASAHRAQLARPVPLAATPALHPGTGRVIAVGPGAYPDLAAAVAAAAPGDTIRIEAGRYAGPRLTLDKDLAIEGHGEVVFVWRGGRGPFIRIAGNGTQVSFTHLRFEAYGINTAVLGDPNQAYGEPPSGSAQVVRLTDVAIDSPQASAIYSTSPGAHYLVEGGDYRGAGSAIIVIDADELVIRPYRGVPTRISTDGTSGVANNAVGLVVHGTRKLAIDDVRWSGDPGGDIAIQGDALAVNVGRSAEPSGTQRVLLVDDRGAPRREIDASLKTEPLRFSVQGGELRPLPEPAPDLARTE
jgi:hypothetical protein